MLKGTGNIRMAFCANHFWALTWILNQPGVGSFFIIGLDAAVAAGARKLPVNSGNKALPIYEHFFPGLQFG
jgi:hypothetical protein